MNKQSEEQQSCDKQEPVGMVAKDGRTILFFDNEFQRIEPFTEVYTTPPHSFFEDVADELRVEIAELQDHVRLLEKQLSQRKPLTDEQIMECAWGLFEDANAVPVRYFARAIEAAHGIKE